MQHFKLSWRNAVPAGRFLLGDKLQRRVDRLLRRRAREEVLREHVLARAAAGNSASVREAMDDFARTQRWLMNVGPEKGRILRQAVESAAPQRVLEIGTYCGYSASLIGEYLLQHGGHLVSIERSRRNSAVARAILAHAGLARCVDVRTGTLASEIATLHGPFDLVFLDHWKDEYLADLKHLEAAALLRPGTVVIADNVGFFAVPDYLAYVRESGRYDSRYEVANVEYQPALEDGVEVSVLRP